MTKQNVTSSVKLALKTWTSSNPEQKGKADFEVIVWGGLKDTPALKKRLGAGIASWQWSELLSSKRSAHLLTGRRGLVLVVRPRLWGAEELSGGAQGLLDSNAYTRGRDSIGQAMTQILDSDSKSVSVDFYSCDDVTVQGALVGLDLTAYQFRRVMNESYPPKVRLILKTEGKSLSKESLVRAECLAKSVNFARHLTNLPPNILNPESFARVLKDVFSKGRNCQVDVWGPTKLKSENMNLILAVGASSDSPPQMVRIRYRPRAGAKAKSSNKKDKTPIAFVGKGITFDTGGVDLKPAAGMRLMKKDMGGAASVAGLAYWVSSVAYPYPCDFYLALAENSIGTGSFRPGDVITSRAGKTVEIHNTDAEGRLVLADVMDVAIESKPRMIVDVATLTGAIKAGLGAGIAGLFGNDDKEVQALANAGQKMGDWMWPMPLFRKYKGALRSTVADLVNASDGFGGAITAALFLEQFVGNIPWMHLDIYAWKDSADGALSESGGSGQSVQALAYWLNEKVEN